MQAANCRSVLVVDDDPEMRETMRLFLEASGFDVTATSNGREALDSIARRRPCVILLDLMMPVMDGWAFLTALDRDESLAAIPIVIVSGHIRGSQLERADDVLEKPVDPAAMIAIVRRHCEAQIREAGPS